MSEPSAETEALVRALGSMSANLPIAALELREGRISQERQRALGALLVELGQLVHRHADMGAPAADTGGSSVPPP